MLNKILNYLMNLHIRTDEEILALYGVLLEKYPIAICDIAMLPRSKSEMKSILKRMYADTLSERQKDILETGFILLSMFQDGVGPTPIDCTLSNGDLKLNMKHDMVKLEKWLLWQKLSQAEQEILVDEWKQFKAAKPI